MTKLYELHPIGFVHGDIRALNIIFRGNKNDETIKIRNETTRETTLENPAQTRQRLRAKLSSLILISEARLNME